MQDVANTDQAEYWNAERARCWVEHDERHDRMLRPFDRHVLDGAAVGPGSRVLDIGCGCGHTTRAAARRAAPGAVLGVDLSAPMLAQARRHTVEAGLGNVRFEQADAQVHRFPDRGFDAAISRFGVMFFADPVAAFANIRTALDDGGRCAFVCWQGALHNAWLTTPLEAMLRHVAPPDLGDPDAPGPFSLARPERIRAVFTGAGFAGVEVEPVREAMWLGRDPADAMDFLQTTGMARTLLEPAPPEAAARAVAAARAALGPASGPDGVVLEAAAWLVRARRG
jgi:SAM-dependent methyltransferase